MDAFTIILAAGAGYLLGSLWYSPLLFGTHWMKLTKKKKQDMNMTPAVIFLGAVGSLLGAFVLAWLITQLGVTGTLAGAALGITVWAGFILPFAANGVLYQTTHPKLFLIDGLYPLAALIVMGAIIA